MKNWEAPRIEELNINETERGSQVHKHIDLNTWDSNHEAITYYCS